MAKASVELVFALRETAARLVSEKAKYQWGSFAHCNCGHLAQTITGLAPEEIQRRAMRREGDWGAQAFDYGDRPALDEGAWEPEDVGACQVTGAPLDEVLEQMYALGLSPSDVWHLERLSDPEVRRQLDTHKQHFRHHLRENVVAYLEAWAALLEERLESAEAPNVYLEAAE